MSYIILYHCLSLGMLFLTYLGSRGTKKELSKDLEFVYVMIALIIISDGSWSVWSGLGFTDPVIGYIINIVYFVASILGVYYWFCYTLKMLDSRLYKNRKTMALMGLPAMLVSMLELSTPFTGYLFTIENGQYVRGSLFFIDSVIKILYLVVTSLFALAAAKNETRVFIKKQYNLLAFYAVPVIVCGLVQAVWGLDFNCVGPVLGLAIVYKHGLANESMENGNIVKSLSMAYAGAFLINVDDHTMRLLYADEDYQADPLMVAGTDNYEKVVVLNAKNNVVPEDRMKVESGFDLDNVLRHLKSKNTYSLIYQVIGKDGVPRYNKATFMKAFGDDDRNDLFLGVEPMETRQMLIQEKEQLAEDMERFERVKERFTNVVADIIEARDVDSGEHVFRVKNYTQLLCNRMMEDYPEYGLTPLKIRYITNGSALHDIGKIMKSAAILMKPGPLTPEEFEVMKTHSEKGCTILDKLPKDLDPEYIKYADEICRWHHERYDGGGYPDGLAGDEIPISAQIVSLADAFDAMTTKRVYKNAYSREEAFEMIINGECGEFNPKLLRCFEKVFQTF